MHGNDYSRRAFLQSSAGAATAALLRGGVPGLAALLQAACSARDEGAPFSSLSPAEARELEAITARIVPTTDTPGAREAGVTWFIDKALGDFLSGQRDFLLGGLQTFQQSIAASFPGAERFSDLAEADQDRHLATQDATPFFQLLHVMTMFGLLGLPSYGGNKDYVGWQLLGLDPKQHGFQPPFGHYDAEFRAEHDDVA